MRHRLLEPHDCIGRVPCLKGINTCLSSLLCLVKYIREKKKAAIFKPQAVSSAHSGSSPSSEPCSCTDLPTCACFPHQAETCAIALLSSVFNSSPLYHHQEIGETLF